MTTLIIFILALYMFFVSWAQMEKTGKPIWLLDTIACGGLSVVCACILGGIL